MAILPTWLAEYPAFLNEGLAHINEARRSMGPVDRSRALLLALNKLWDTFARFRQENDQLTETEKSNGLSDAQSIRKLVLTLSYREKTDLLTSEGVRNLVAFTPHIMNHDLLRRRAYHPANIPDRLRLEASAEHRQFMNAFGRWQGDQSDADFVGAALNKLAQLLYIVRSNIAHGEKTQYGPDLDKAERDRAVTTTANPVIEDLLDALLQRPSRRVAVYGTLAPGGANHGQLSRISGDWCQGTVKGEINDESGLPAYVWREPSDRVAVHLLDSDDFPELFEALDHFEGRQYQRILVPVALEGGITVSNIYEWEPDGR